MLLRYIAAVVSLALGLLAVSDEVPGRWAQGGWDRTFGGPKDDHGYSVRQTSDGGFILVGETKSFGAGDFDLWLIKTDAKGNMVWNRTFGGEDWDYGYSVQQTSDGGFILLGGTRSFGVGGWDLWLIKTDGEGHMLWQRTFGGEGDDGGVSVQQTSDGGFILLGVTEPPLGGYDFWLIKTDAEGNMLWNRTFNNNRWDYGFSVQQTSDGGFILLGFTGSILCDEGSDLWLIKTDGEGNMLWNRTFGGNDCDYGYSVQQTSDGGFILAGQTGSFGAGKSELWLIKTDGEGKMLWNRTFGGSGSDGGASVQQTSDGGFILLGETESFGVGGPDFWLIKTDTEGNMVWNRTFGGSAGDYGSSVQQTSDGGFILLGQTNSFGAGGYDFWLIKTDAEGR